MKNIKLNESFFNFQEWGGIEFCSNSFEEDLEEKLEKAYNYNYKALYNDYEKYELGAGCVLVFARAKALNILVELAEEYGYSLGWDEILEDEYGITEDDVENCNDEKRLIKKLFGINESLKESFIEADEFNGSDDEFQRLFNRIYDRLSDYKNKYGDIELTIYDLPEIEFDELSLYPEEYTYDFSGDDFGSNLVYDLAEFLDIPVNEVTDKDIDDFDSIKFYKFLCDKYYDDIVEVCKDDDDFLSDLWKEEDEKSYWENNEPDWDDRY